MRLRYTGRADRFVYGGKEYHPGDFVPISKEDAARESARTNLHSFETVEGADVLEQATAPDPKPAAAKS